VLEHGCRILSLYCRLGDMEREVSEW
jgi:hypothetical protein